MYHNLLLKIEIGYDEQMTQNIYFTVAVLDRRINEVRLMLYRISSSTSKTYLDESMITWPDLTVNKIGAVDWHI